MYFKEVYWEIKKSLKNFLNHFIGLAFKSPNFSKLYWITIQNIKEIKLQIDTKLLEILTKPKYGNIRFNEIFYIDPKKVKYMLNNKKYFHWKRSYRILDGDWDKNRILFSDYNVFDSIKKKYVNGENWENTELYNLLPEKVKNKEIWTFKNERGRDLEIAKIEKLYKNIKTLGYKRNTRKEPIKNWFLRAKLKPIIDEVALGIGRDGDFFFINGKHRLSIAKVLNLKKIPVIFLIRHKKWMIFRKRFSMFINQDYTPKCANIKHPDLQNINFIDCKEIFENLKEDLNSCQKPIILTYGAKLGYICSKFEESGTECIAIEPNPIYYYFLTHLKKIEGWKFKIFQEIKIERLKMINFTIFIIEDHVLNELESLNEIINYINYFNIEIIYIKKSKNLSSSKLNNKLDLLMNMIIDKTNLRKSNKLFSERKVGEIIKIYN